MAMPSFSQGSWDPTQVSIPSNHFPSSACWSSNLRSPPAGFTPAGFTPARSTVCAPVLLCPVFHMGAGI